LKGLIEDNRLPTCTFDTVAPLSKYLHHSIAKMPLNSHLAF